MEDAGLGADQAIATYVTLLILPSGFLNALQVELKTAASKPSTAFYFYVRR